MVNKTCNWVENENGDWDTDCGQIFVFNDYRLPSENRFKFCCFCGGALNEVVLDIDLE